MVLYLMLMTQLMLMFSLLNKKLVGYIVTIFITLTGVISIDYIHNMKWKLPVAHAIFGTHFRDFYYKPEMSLNTSFAYFILLIAIVMAINCFLVKKYKFGDMNNDSDQ